MKTKIYFMNCQHIRTLCNKSDYGEAGALQRLVLQAHLLFCTACRKYQRQNKRLSALLRRAGLQCLSDQQKEDLVEKMKQSGMQPPQKDHD